MTDFSVVLWTLGALVAATALHLANGWVRMARRGGTLRQEWRSLSVASSVLGVGVSSALVLGLQAQELAFPVGYSAWLALALLAAAVLAAAPVVAVAALSTHVAACAAAGVLLSAAVLSLQFGWVQAAGFRPGVPWRIDLLVVAGLVLALGLTVSYWLAGAETSDRQDRRILRRVAAGVLGGLVLMAGQEIMMLAAGLSMQKASAHASELRGTWLSLLCGVVVPFVLVAMTLDLWWLRRNRRHRSHADFNPTQRRKHRHKVRTL